MVLMEVGTDYRVEPFYPFIPYVRGYNGPAHICEAFYAARAGIDQHRPAIGKF